MIETVVHMGYPEEFGKAIAKNLGSEQTMRRMTAYLYSAKLQRHFDPVMKKNY